jgi:hypothetical protein
MLEFALTAKMPCLDFQKNVSGEVKKRQRRNTETT